MAGLIGEWEEGVLRKLGLRGKNDGCSCFAEDTELNFAEADFPSFRFYWKAYLELNFDVDFGKNFVVASYYVVNFDEECSAED